MRLRRLPTLLAAVAAAALLLPVVAQPASAASAASASLDALAVSGNPGEKPTVTSEWPFSVKSTVSEVRSPGTGAVLAKGDRVAVDFLILNGRTGEELQTSFGAGPTVVPLGAGTAAPVRAAMVGAPVGSRLVLAVAPKDGLTKQGASVGLKKNDTLVYVIDVRATSTAVDPAAGLPTVKLAKSGAPKIFMPKADAPTELVVQPLIQGPGPVVESGQVLNVHYTGAIWNTGKVFDSSWSGGQPAQFEIGTGKVIAGWDEGLVGQTVGSQVLLVIPPEKGYGAAGQSQAGIKGTDTLVFVVDILAAG